MDDKPHEMVDFQVTSKHDTLTTDFTLSEKEFHAIIVIETWTISFTRLGPYNIISDDPVYIPDGCLK